MNVIDNIRLNGFRQLKKEVRGSKKHLIVGIDVAKESHKAFFGTATGKTFLRRLVVSFINIFTNYVKTNQTFSNDGLQAQH